MRNLLKLLVRGVLRVILKLAGHLIYRLRIEGSHHIPAKGGALLVASHASFMDFVLVVCSTGRPVRFIMNAGIFRKPGLNWILRNLDCIPVESGLSDEQRQAFNTAVASYIETGHLVVIFAEGTVTRTGQLLEFKKGVEHISRLITSPVIGIHFDNVPGSPFTYRAGHSKIEGFRWRTLRRMVRVNIGPPLNPPVDSFALRQRMKELEAQSFARRFGAGETIAQKIHQVLMANPRGGWRSGKEFMPFERLHSELARINNCLEKSIRNDGAVAVLLPRSLDLLTLNLALVISGQCVVNIDPATDNEERYAICRMGGIRTLITTRDLAFTRFAPDFARVVYIEELREAIKHHRPANVVCRQLGQAGNYISSFWGQNKLQEKPVTLLFERQPDGGLQMTSLTNHNLLASIAALRQVHYFPKGERMLAMLDLHRSAGFVLALLLPVISQLELIYGSGQPDSFIAQLLEACPGLVIAAPEQLSQIAELATQRNIPHLTHIFTAMVHPKDKRVQLLQSRGIAVLTCASLNQASGVFAVNVQNAKGIDLAGMPLEQEAHVSGSLGKPLPGVCVRVADAQNPNHELPPDVPGRLWLSGAAIALCNRDAHGWLNSGLNGYINRQGFIFLTEEVQDTLAGPVAEPGSISSFSE